MKGFHRHTSSMSMKFLYIKNCILLLKIMRITNDDRNEKYYIFIQ